MKEIQNKSMNQTDKAQSNVQNEGYMGDATSKTVGSMAYAGRLGGEMVKRMIASVEEDMASGKVKPEDLM